MVLISFGSGNLFLVGGYDDLYNLIFLSLISSSQDYLLLWNLVKLIFY